MNLFQPFTLDDVRQANSDVIGHQQTVSVNLSPAAHKLLRQAQFTAAEINHAFAEAHRATSTR